MTNGTLLKSAVYRIGLTLQELAKLLGMTQSTLSYKINNKHPFTAPEIIEISKVLKLSASERDEIFFVEK